MLGAKIMLASAVAGEKETVLLVGAGRQGTRHLKGLAGVNCHVTQIARSTSSRDASRQLWKMSGAPADALSFCPSVGDIEPNRKFSAVILSETADARTKNFAWAIRRGIENILLEKPVCTSRKQLTSIIEIMSKSSAKVSVNFYRRCLPFFLEFSKRLRLEKNRPPLNMTVTSGARGLAMNGIHWIDFALYLTGALTGKLLFAEVSKVPIESGRGPQFRDYGGIAIFGFPCGSRLTMNIIPTSSAPATFSIYEDHRMITVDQDGNCGIIYERHGTSTKPPYLCGQDYLRKEVEAVESIDLSKITQMWLLSIKGDSVNPLPSLQTAAVSHALLFDLLETSKRKGFSFA